MFKLQDFLHPGSPSFKTNTGKERATSFSGLKYEKATGIFIRTVEHHFNNFSIHPQTHHS